MLSRGVKDSFDPSESFLDEGESDSPRQVSPMPGGGAGAEAMRVHLESVQRLLRSMEQRLIARDVELEQSERRAREQVDIAQAKANELEQLVSQLRIVS